MSDGVTGSPGGGADETGGGLRMLRAELGRLGYVSPPPPERQADCDAKIDVYCGDASHGGRVAVGCFFLESSGWAVWQGNPVKPQGWGLRRQVLADDRPVSSADPDGPVRFKDALACRECRRPFVVGEEKLNAALDEVRRVGAAEVSLSALRAIIGKQAPIRKGRPEPGLRG